MDVGTSALEACSEKTRPLKQGIMQEFLAEEESGWYKQHCQDLFRVLLLAHLKDSGV
jgi:hypothetical protein